jgi:hypothetical protein
MTDKSAIRRTIHNSDTTEHQRPTVKLIHRKVIDDFDFKGGNLNFMKSREISGIYIDMKLGAAEKF